MINAFSIILILIPAIKYVSSPLRKLLANVKVLYNIIPLNAITPDAFDVFSFLFLLYQTKSYNHSPSCSEDAISKLLLSPIIPILFLIWEVIHFVVRFLPSLLALRYSEVIFFTLDKAILEEWESITEVIKRADEIKQRFEKAPINLQDVEIAPRFILLHTLSHLLIRELEASAGYPAASLKERIYCSKSKKMAGILVYTAVPDIVGSLGGIINSAEPRTLLTILDNVFKKARWCSLDPVCTEHEGQGPGWLNRAACHACSLIPEPACEYGNVFLDRVFIKGDDEKGIPSFLDFAFQHKKDNKEK